MLKLPSPEARLTPRLLLRVKLLVALSVPPLKVSRPGIAVPGTAPRLASLEMLNTPALRVVTPL